MAQFSRPKVLAAALYFALSIALLAWLLLRNQSDKGFRAMPSNVSIVLKINGLSATIRQADSLPDAAWREVLRTSFFGQLRRDLATVRRIFPAQSPVGQALETRPLVAGLTFNDSDTLHAVFALEFESETEPEKWLSESRAVAKKFPSTFRGRTIYTLQLAGNERFAVAGIGRLLLFSRLPYLVEDAVTALEKGENACSDGGLRPLDSEHTEFYLQPALLAEQAAGKLAAGWDNLPALLRENTGWLRLAWDGQRIENQLDVRGLLRGVAGNSAVPRGEIFSILPDHTALLLWAGFGNRQSFFSNLTGIGDADFQRFIAPWAGREMAFVLTEPFSSDLAEEQFLVFGVQDSARAGALMRQFGERFGVLKAYDYQTFAIRQFAHTGALAAVTGADGGAFRNPVFARVGSYCVFAHSPAAMELWIDKFIVSQTLANSPDFLLLAKKLPTQSRGLAFLNGHYLPALAKSLLTEKVADAETATIFARTGLVALDFRAENGSQNPMPVLAVSQPLGQRAASETTILWKTPLAAQAVTQPFFVESPRAGEAAILVQDGKNQLYRLAPNGEIRWRRPMDARLGSAVQGFDYLGNQSLCYLFSTASKIYLLDDEGRDVEGFPLELKSPATNGVALVKFSKSGDYAFFIGCANGNLYGFDRHGRPLPGWNPQAGVGRVAFPLLHFQHQNKDFLVALNQAGQLHVFGRDGDRRFEAVQFDGQFAAPPQADAGKQSPRIVCANTAGRAFVCNLEGEIFGLSLSKNPLGGFVFAPLAGDGRKDYASISGRDFSMAGYEGSTFKTLVSKQLPSKADTIFEVRAGQSGSQIGALSEAKREVWLLDGKGRIHPDFPLAGTTAFTVGDVFGTGQGRVLLVGNGASVYAYSIR